MPFLPVTLVNFGPAGDILGFGAGYIRPEHVSAIGSELELLDGDQHPIHCRRVELIGGHTLFVQDDPQLMALTER